MSDKVPFLVSEGQRVQAGETIGISGDTGISTGAHLHLAIRIDGEFVDPHKYLERLLTGDPD